MDTGGRAVKGSMERLTGNPEFPIFLELFKHLPASRFALIKISGSTLMKHMDQISSDIAFLNRLGVYPIVVHGAGSELDRLLPDSKKIDGVRITPPKDMQVIREVMQQLNLQLTIGIVEKGGSAVGLSDVIRCEPLEGYGRVGRVTGVDTGIIGKVLDGKATPVICPLGVHDGEYHNVNADTAAKGVVEALGSKKFILLTETGGILDSHSRVIPFLNLSPDLDGLNISGGMLHKVREISAFIEKVRDCEVVITSAQGLLREMFTVKGSGTILKYHDIKVSTHLEEEQAQLAKRTLENAFSKELEKGFFDRGPMEVIHQRELEGLAVLRPMGNQWYLDKFAVAKAFQGTGLGKSLWEKMLERHPNILWRASPDNPFNAFYQANCSGMVRLDRWTVYWNGIDPTEAMGSVNDIASMKITLNEKKV